MYNSKLRCVIYFSWAFVLVLTILAGSAAADLTSDLKVSVKPKQTDSFQISGSTTGLNLDSFNTLTFTLGQYTFEFDADDFQKSGTKLVLGDGTAMGISKFEVDLAKEVYWISGRGLSLSSLSNPLAVQLATDATSLCELVQTKSKKSGKTKKGTASATAKKKKRGAASSVLLLNKTLGECLSSELPQAVPNNIIRGEATSLRISVTFNGNPDAGTAQVFRAAGGLPSGSALGTMSQAPDGGYGCEISLTGGNEEEILLLVQASVSGEKVLSESFSIGVVAPLDDAAAQKIISLQEGAETILSDNLAQYGDTLEARVKTIRQIRAQNGITDVELSADGSNIVIYYESGVSGVLLLSRREEGTDAATVPAHVSPAASSSNGKGLIASAGAHPVLIWDPGFFEEDNEAPILKEILEASQYDAFAVTYLQGEQANIDALRSLTSYQTVHITSHGVVGPRRQVAIVAADEVTEERVKDTYKADLQAGRLSIATEFKDKKPVKQFFLIMPGFIEALSGTFSNAIVFSSTCHSTENLSMAAAFIRKGAKTYLGFTRKTSTSHAYKSSIQFYCATVAERLSSGSAHNIVTPKLDPIFPSNLFTLAGSLSHSYPTDPPYELTFTPETTQVPADTEQEFELNIPDNIAKHCFKFAYTTTGAQGEIVPPVGSADLVPVPVDTVLDPRTTYRANADAIEGEKDTVTAKIYRQISHEKIDELEAEVEIAQVIPVEVTTKVYENGPQGYSGTWIVGAAGVFVDIPPYSSAGYCIKIYTEDGPTPGVHPGDQFSASPVVVKEPPSEYFGFPAQDDVICGSTSDNGCGDWLGQRHLLYFVDGLLPSPFDTSLSYCGPNVPAGCGASVFKQYLENRYLGWKAIVRLAPNQAAQDGGCNP